LIFSKTNKRKSRRQGRQNQAQTHLAEESYTSIEIVEENKENSEQNLHLKTIVNI